MKRIVFLLPGPGNVPIGGYKVVYEYANRLVADGYEVTIVYPAFCKGFHESGIRRFSRQRKAVMQYIYQKIRSNYGCDTWFYLHENVRECLVWSLDERYVPKGDVYVATSLITSYYLSEYTKIPSSRKYYLIQCFENWWGATDEDVKNSYRLPLHKIVIAEWLEQLVHECNENCTLIHNGFDFNYFSQSLAFEDKDKFCITMLSHTAPWKGCQDGFDALEIVKNKYPQLKVNLFGVNPRPMNLPDWYRYYQQPDKMMHNKIYNEAAIFLGPSHNEGFCLTPPEAMQCGCAVVCTDIGGYTVVCKDDNTALVAPIKRPDLLAEKIIYLIEHDEERYRIAENGHKFIANFTWDKAYEKFKITISEV